MSALSFFIGKGGVGKTTLASAYAVWRTTRRPRKSVFLLSTDPAHSLADIFQLRLGHKPCSVRLSASAPLTVWQMDASREFKSFLDRHRSAILQVIESGTIFSRAEIEPLLNTTLPGMAEMAGLIALHRLIARGEHDEIVVDTAPMGHTLRLFEMPQHFARFLRFLDAAASRDRLLSQRFGGGAIASQPFIAGWKRMIEHVQDALAHPDSRLLLVTTPENFSLQESLRAARYLAKAEVPLRVHEVVLNRVVRHRGRCSLCRNRARALRPALAVLRREFGRAIHIAEDVGIPIMGLKDLRAFGEHVFAGKRLRLSRRLPATQPKIQLIKTEWPVLPAPLTLTIGKGGVGKTTVSAALAFHHRCAEEVPVLVCSTDPAPSLDDVFAKPVTDRPTRVAGGLRAVEIDSVAHFRAWAQDMKARLEGSLAAETSGVHVDLALDREIFMALLDVVPPGVDEVFAIFRILELARKGQKLVIDMAPTAHALELLRMPERILLWSRLLLKTLAPHRTLNLVQDAAAEIAGVSHRVRKLAEMLRDRRRSRVVAVMLPEPLPDQETRRLLEQLQDLQAPASVLVVNRVLLSDGSGNCQRCRNVRAWQRVMLAGLPREIGPGQVYLVPEYPTEIAGPAALKAFTRNLWRLTDQPTPRKLPHRPSISTASARKPPGAPARH